MPRRLPAGPGARGLRVHTGCALLCAACPRGGGGLAARHPAGGARGATVADAAQPGPPVAMVRPGPLPCSSLCCHAVHHERDAVPLCCALGSGMLTAGRRHAFLRAPSLLRMPPRLPSLVHGKLPSRTPRTARTLRSCEKSKPATRRHAAPAATTASAAGSTGRPQRSRHRCQPACLLWTPEATTRSAP